MHTVQLTGADGGQQPVDLGATFVCGTSRVPPVNPILEYAVDRLGLTLKKKYRDGPKATALYDQYALDAPLAPVTACGVRGVCFGVGLGGQVNG